MQRFMSLILIQHYIRQANLHKISIKKQKRETPKGLSFPIIKINLTFFFFYHLSLLDSCLLTGKITQVIQLSSTNLTYLVHNDALDEW